VQEVQVLHQPLLLSLAVEGLLHPQRQWHLFEDHLEAGVNPKREKAKEITAFRALFRRKNSKDWKPGWLREPGVDPVRYRLLFPRFLKKQVRLKALA